jgi:hypothetical protein
MASMQDRRKGDQFASQTCLTLLHLFQLKSTGFTGNRIAFFKSGNAKA